MPSFQVPVLGSLFVSFRPSLIRFPQLFLRCFPYALAFGIFRFPSASFRPLPFRLRLLSLLLLPFCPLDLRLTVGFPSRLRFLSSPSLLPFIHGWFPVRFLPVLHTQLSVRFLSSFLASLPQLFHECFPFGLSPSDPLSFVRVSSGSDYSASVLPFPASRFRLTVASSVLRSHFRSCGLPRSLQPDFSCLPSRFRYSASCSFPFALP